jgi:NADPH2:quinone reductase
MRAIVITERGGPGVLAMRDVADPEPGPFDILVDVAASALNRADLLQRRGLYPAPPGSPADIPGLEFAGTVLAIGAAVTRFQPGDRVMGIVGGGAAAERLIVHEREAMRVPAGLALTEAAAIPEAFATAFDAAVLQGGLASGQWLVVNAVGSGVGTAAIQIARALGARSVGSSRTPTKLGLARGFGLDVAVEGDSTALPAAVREATGGAGAAVAVDLVGGPGLGAMLECLRPTGTAVLVGLMGGVEAPISLARVLRHRLRIVGTVLRSRGLEEKIALARAFEDRMVPLFEGGNPRLRPVVDRVVSWTDVAQAHEHLESNESFGKIVLEHR